MARLAAGMSRQGAAEEVNVSVQTIYNWETGRHTPSRRCFEALCATYGVHPQELMSDVFRSLAEEGAPAPEKAGGLEPLVARELAKLPRELQRDLLLKWIPLASDMGARIAEAWARYEAETESSRGDGDNASKIGDDS